METVGFIGLGRMGSAMAGNIQKAGYPMVVHDVREAATMPLLQGGAQLVSSPAEVGRRSEVIFTSLPRPEDVEAVTTRPEGLLEGIQEGSVYLDLSTCGPDLVRRLEPMFRQKGAYVIDAPVLSSPTRAVTRSLIVMVGGEREVYERIQPMLEAFADKVIYAGSLGSGCICKLVHNMMSFAMGQVVAEGLTLGVKAGVELEALVESGSRGLLGSRQELLAQTVFQGQFEPPSFTLSLSRKDVGLATELGRQTNVPMPVANLVEQLLVQGINQGWAEQDYTVAFRLQEAMAGVQVRAPNSGG
ncbi:MAG: NAD(P)-dependent oxidoreductase [Candidatus Tectomicrobia bacterium]|nr:NAD(P)-dependent oxidoreductase [Candidatus Tectomicrobia bacterium]